MAGSPVRRPPGHRPSTRPGVALTGRVGLSAPGLLAQTGCRRPGGLMPASTEEELTVLYVFGFEQTAVVLSDLYFVDPDPLEGQESPEHGVRLEVRAITPGPLQGGIYSAQPIEIGDLIWRADLLESVDGPPGSFDRTHHHPGVSRGLEPGPRVFDRKLSAAPVEWVVDQLADLEGLLKQAGEGGTPADAADAQS